MYRNSAKTNLRYENDNDTEEHIYYDLKITNNYTQSQDERPKLFVQKDECGVILDKQSDYRMAVASFAINLSIPITIMLIDSGLTQNDINLTIYSITMTNETTGVNYQERPIFIPDFNIPLNPLSIPKSPQDNNGVQDFSTGYYNVYSYYAWCVMINNAFKAIQTRINNDTPNAMPNAPHIVYENEKFSIVYPKEMFNSNTGDPQFTMFFNVPLAIDIAGFPSRLNRYNDPDGKDISITLIPPNDIMARKYNPDNSNIPPATIPAYYIMTAEFDVRFRFNAVAGLVLVSDHISVRKEYYPDNVGTSIYGSNISTFNTPSLAVVSSFAMVDLGGSDYLTPQYYEPSFYKWIDLVGDQPLNAVDIKLFLQMKRGGLIPAFVPLNTMSIIKFAFQKKKSTAK